MNKVLVTNNTGNINRIPIGGLRAPDHVTLMPGANEVDADKWAECEKIALVRDHYKVATDAAGRALIVVVKIAGDNALAGKKPTEAVALVGETVDAKLLRSWMETEKRGKVREAIATQLELISVPPAPKPDEAQE